MSVISLDFETFYSNKLKYGLRQQIAEQYCRSHHFDAYMISASDGANHWAGHPRDFNWESLAGQTVVAHNLFFDKTVLLELERRQLIPKISDRVAAWHCTANLTAYICNRRALDDAVEHLFKIKLDKSARSDANGKHWPKDFSAAEQITMFDYARKDAFWCWKLFNDFGSQWPERERRLSDLTIRQGMFGVQINTALLDEYIVQSHEILKNTEAVIPWIADSEDEEWSEFNTKPTSTKCIAEQCRRSGIPCPPVRSDDQEAYDEWETLYACKHQWITALTGWRSVNKLYKTFLLVKERLRDDGTMPFSLKYFGAHTGRWSGDARVNMQNPRKRPIVCNEFGLLEFNDLRIDSAMQTKKETGKLPEWVRYVIDFRALIIPRPGKRMVVSDLSQIEPRVLAYLSGNWKLLNMLKDGMSIYEAHSRATMGWTGGKLKDENPEMYKLAKARILALGYGAAWEKFVTMARDLSGIDITIDDPEFIEQVDPFTGVVEKVSGYGKRSREIVSEFRAQNPETTGLWYQLDGAFKRSVGDDFVMELPSGRKLRYEKVRCELRVLPDHKTKKPVRTSVFTAGIGGRRFMSYGGKLCENLVQAASRDVFAEHLLQLDNTPGVTNLFHAHDEAIVEVDDGVTAKNVEQIMSICPEWLKNCPIAAEAKEVAHYCK